MTTRYLRHRTKVACTGLALIALAVSACGGGSASSAGAEDKVIVYYSTRPEEGLPPLKKAFEAANPGYELKVIRASTGDTLARLLTEGQSGKQAADVTEVSALAVTQLEQAGLLGKLPDSVLATLPASGKSPSGTYAGTRYFRYVTPYNTKLVPEADRPKSFDDFLKPYWNGKFVLGSDDIEWAYDVYASKGEQGARDFFKAIAAQKPQLRSEGSGAQAELVAIGQIRASMMTLSYHITNRQKKGLPIDGFGWQPPLLNIDWLATFKKAPHPNATTVFLKWLYSPAGIATDAQLGFSRIGDAGSAEALGQPNLLILAPTTVDDQQKAAKLFKEVFSAG
ncbi:MAG: hypothetical protein JWQ95_1578 [Sphaerisporangium sp.]|nr:hypothetical protein [Sphaerisporangium sp.]